MLLSVLKMAQLVLLFLFFAQDNMGRLIYIRISLNSAAKWSGHGRWFKLWRIWMMNTAERGFLNARLN